MKNKKIVIDVNVNDKKDLFNPYNDKLLNSDLSSYILNQFKGKSLKGNVVVNIHSNISFTEEEKKQLRLVFKKNFHIIDYEDDMYNRINRYKALFLLVVGILFISLSYFLDIKNIYIGRELVLIIGWVAIWELCDYLLFSETKNRMKSRRIDQLSKAKINFGDDSEDGIS